MTLEEKNNDTLEKLIKKHDYIRNAAESELKDAMDFKQMRKEKVTFDNDEIESDLQELLTPESNRRALEILYK